MAGKAKMRTQLKWDTAMMSRLRARGRLTEGNTNRVLPGCRTMMDGRAASQASTKSLHLPFSYLPSLLLPFLSLPSTHLPSSARHAPTPENPRESLRQPSTRRRGLHFPSSTKSLCSTIALEFAGCRQPPLGLPCEAERCGRAYAARMGFASQCHLWQSSLCGRFATSEVRGFMQLIPCRVRKVPSRI